MHEGPASKHDAGVNLPAGTSAPLYLALGLALLLVSLVTSAFFAYAGALVFLWAAVGWWQEMFPLEKKEFVSAPAGDEEAPAGAIPRRVMDISAGDDRHRARLPLEYHPYAAGLKGGLVAGIVMAVAAAAHGVIFEGDLWHPFQGFARIVLPLFDISVPGPGAGLGWGIIAAAGLVHVLFSLLLGVVYASLLPMFPGHPRFWGGLAGPLLWSGAGFLCIELVEPWVVTQIDWPAFVFLQVVFGTTAGEVISRSTPVQTLQSYPLAARAGLEVGKEEDEA